MKCRNLRCGGGLEDVGDCVLGHKVVQCVHCKERYVLFPLSEVYDFMVQPVLLLKRISDLVGGTTKDSPS